jgi:hypothetical protein
VTLASRRDGTIDAAGASSVRGRTLKGADDAYRAYPADAAATTELDPRASSAAEVIAAPRKLRYHAGRA